MKVFLDLPLCWYPARLFVWMTQLAAARGFLYDVTATQEVTSDSDNTSQEVIQTR